MANSMPPTVYSRHLLITLKPAGLLVLTMDIPAEILMKKLRGCGD